MSFWLEFSIFDFFYFAKRRTDNQSFLQGDGPSTHRYEPMTSMLLRRTS